MNLILQDTFAQQRSSLIPQELVERVRESADIVQIIGEHVKLRRVGTDFRGPCPFHGGKNPNFSVSLRQGVYYCFKCQESGNAFTFLQKQLGLSFPDAVRAVATTVGITPTGASSVPAPTRQPSGPTSRPQSRLDRLDAAAWAWAACGESLAFDIIQRELLSRLPLSAQGREYFAQRSLCADTAYYSGVRSIDDWSAFASDLTALGHELGFDAWNIYAAGFVPPGTYRMPEAQPFTVRQWLSPRYACDAIPALLFVYRDVDGTAVGLRFRALTSHKHKALSARHIDGLTESCPAPFGAELLGDCGGRIVHIAEGEPDTLALRDVGALALGLPGTTIPGHRSDPPARWMLALRSARAVCLWTDADLAGEELARRLADDLRAIGLPHLRRVRWPKRPEKDANDLLRAGVLADTVAALEETV